MGAGTANSGTSRVGTTGTGILTSTDRRRCILMAPVLACLVQGCATLLNGPYQTIPLSSEPPGAETLVDGQRFETPVNVRLHRSRTHTVTFVKAGYERADVTLMQEETSLLGLNLFFYILLPPLIVVGPLIDYLSGSAYELTPAAVSVRLNEQLR